MTTQPLRWQQRLNNYQRACKQLASAAALSQQRPLSELEQQGLIQAFEYTHELAWNVMKDYFVWQGNSSLTGSRDATREAFQQGLISDGERWMEMIASRNQTSHTYNRVVADAIANSILQHYHPLFMAFAEQMDTLSQQLSAPPSA